MRKLKAGAAPDMRRCADCAHHFGAADPGCYRAVLPACVYILDTGRRRPCPAGEGCTEYERAPRGREAYREGLRREYTAFRAERGGGE